MFFMNINQNNFQKEIIEYQGLALVDFWAQWCGPCRMMSPIIEELFMEFDGRAKIAKVNVDQNYQLAQEYDVMSLPTFVFFKDGRETDRIVGVVSKEDLKTKLKVLLNEKEFL